MGWRKALEAGAGWRKSVSRSAEDYDLGDEVAFRWGGKGAVQTGIVSMAPFPSEGFLVVKVVTDGGPHGAPVGILAMVQLADVVEKAEAAG